MIMNVTASTDKMKELIIRECPDYYSFSEVRKAIEILKFVNETDAETMYEYMKNTERPSLLNEDERKRRLEELKEALKSKYQTSHDSLSHYCFKIKPVDVKDIVNHFNDVFMDSNLYISPATNHHQGYSFAEFEVYATDIYFGLKSKKWDKKTHFDAAIRMDEAAEIEVDISCGTILSFHFTYPDCKRYDQISFRND